MSRISSISNRRIPTTTNMLCCAQRRLSTLFFFYLQDIVTKSRCFLKQTQEGREGGVIDYSIEHGFHFMEVHCSLEVCLLLSIKVQSNLDILYNSELLKQMNMFKK